MQSKVNEYNLFQASGCLGSQQAQEQSEFLNRIPFEVQWVDYIFVLDSDGTIVDANQAAFDIHGYAREELLGNSIRLLDSCEQQESFVQRLMGVKQGTLTKFEVEHRRKDGSTFPVEVSVKVLEHSGKDYVFCFERDISLRKKVEAEHGKSKEIFHTANLNSVLWVCDQDWRFLYVSENSTSIFGPEKINSEIWTLLEIVHPEDRSFLLHYKDNPPEKEVDIEYRVILGDGTVGWLRTRAFPVRDETGLICRFAGITENISESRLVRKKLEESELLYRTFFEENMDGIAILKEETTTGRESIFRVMDCNESFLQLAGRGKEELLAIEDLSSIQRQVEFTNIDRQKPGQHTYTRGVFSWLRPDGRENYIEFRRLPETIGGRKITYSIQRDITEQRIAEKRIRHLSRRLIQVAEEEQKRIARDLHDQFGKMLPQIRHGLEALQLLLPSRNRRLQNILRKLIFQYGEVGDVCRTIATRLRPDILDQLGLIPALQSCCEDFRCMCPEVDLDIQVFGRGKGLSPETEIVLFRLLQEGLTNIHKHAMAKRVTISLTFSYPEVILIIKDNGRGFGEDDAVNNFENGFGKGKGLGLFGMRERVSALGGNLVVASSQEKGTVIRAALPANLEGTDGNQHNSG